jgi:HEAT repeat protein
MSKKDTTAKLKKDLLNEKSEPRKKALKQIKEWKADEALPLLVELLDCKNDDILEDITRTMLYFKDKALPYLVKVLCSDSWRRRKAASGILSRLGTNSLKKLMELVPENEEDVDYWMVQTLSNMGGEASQYLVRIFSHPNQRIRLAAVRAAQNVDDPRMVTALLHLLEDPSWPVRKAAYDSLEKVYVLNRQAVSDALEDCSDEAMFWIIKLIALQPQPEQTGKLAEIIESAPMESKLEAIKALAMIETTEAHQLLVSYLAHKAWIIRKTAADAIWTQGLGVSEELISAINGANVDARYWSVKILGQSQEPGIFTEIVKCLQDGHSSVRAAACQALGSLGDKRSLAPLMAVLNDESEDVRTAAILALSHIGEKEEINKVTLPAHLRKENTFPCPHCGKAVGSNFSFCPFCLGHLRNTCKACGRAVEPNWKGCPDCGAPLK